MKRPYIIYFLSKDRTTQKFNTGKINDILKGLEAFLSAHTTADFKKPASIDITVYNDDKNTQALILRKAIEQFGQTEPSPIAYHYPSGIPDYTTTKHAWELSGDKFQDALQFIITNNSLPKADFGPLELFITYRFKLVDAGTKDELPNQEDTSHFCIWFSKGKAISPTIFFPFEYSDEKFWNYLDKISLDLPFKVEEKYLRIAHVNKKGEVNSFKKIVRPV